MTNILVCDDEKDIVNAMKIYLEAEDYNVYSAYNGEQAVKTVLSKEIHLIIMDIMMPVMDGIQAMIKIREQSNVPIILLTAKGEDSDKVLGLNVGADDYVTKPFTPIELMARVRSQLRRYMKLGSAGINDAVLTIGEITLNEAK
ncbi:MAG: response regulator transcription factor, partial [Lachnospiraceae bacterium]|nr:response regulator transcription factor [Lachnospiraceae bacterium]